MDEVPEDIDYSPQERAAVERLTAADVAAIDGAILTQLTDHQRKVAMVVAKAMKATKDLVERGVPDIFYRDCVIHLASKGLIETFGDLRYMRFSEIRRPSTP